MAGGNTARPRMSITISFGGFEPGCAKCSNSLVATEAARMPWLRSTSSSSFVVLPTMITSIHTQAPVRNRASSHELDALDKRGGRTDRPGVGNLLTRPRDQDPGDVAAIGGLHENAEKIDDMQIDPP